MDEKIDEFLQRNFDKEIDEFLADRHTLRLGGFKFRNDVYSLKDIKRISAKIQTARLGGQNREV